MKLYARAICLLISLVMILAAGTGCSRKKVVRIALGTTPATNCAGIYGAIESGHYDESGLRVKFIEGEDPLRLVVDGEADFAVTSQGELAPVLAAKDPLPLTAVGALVSRNTYGILSLSETGIYSPINFCGKRIATRGTPLESTVIRHMVELDGGNFDEVELVLYEGNDPFAFLQARSADAVWIDMPWGSDHIQLEQLGLNYIVLPDFDPALDFYSTILVANNEWLAKNPDTVRAFWDATANGGLFVEANSETMAEIICSKYMPGTNYDLVAGSLDYLNEAVLFQSIIFSVHWANFNDWMYERGLLERPLGPDGFTNQYLPV